MSNPIPEEKIGLVTPRAFAKYDPRKQPDAKYFREILQNSLTEVEIGEFCEDFLRLLNVNKKCHKDKVLSLIGDANSGKTSLFQPILGLVHHSNIATVNRCTMSDAHHCPKETSFQCRTPACHGSTTTKLHFQAPCSAEEKSS